MKQKLWIAMVCLVGLLLQNCYGQGTSESKDNKKSAVYSRTDTSKVTQSNAEWQKVLPPEIYEVARLKGTERPFTSEYEHSKDVGTFYCAVCGNALFKSNAKYESGCGWPSFFQPITKTSLIETADNSHGMRRVEVMCGRCKSHLGHVFNDGPPPTGLRYCINGVVLDFEKAQAADKKYSKRKSRSDS